jgi:hypothetical protein
LRGPQVPGFIKEDSRLKTAMVTLKPAGVKVSQCSVPARQKKESDMNSS